ncbi:MAG: hypothetical protein Q7R70_01565 [Candidatus Diapherotrites archaeon]|nr:hypothetical protein [Candidatus Diapherotrites archaeon]
MENTRQIIIYGTIIAILTIACGYFLSNSGFEAIQLATLTGLQQTAAKMLSFGFLAFLVIAAIDFAVINALCLKEDNKKIVYEASFIGLAIGIAFTLLAFGASTERIFLSIFLLISIIALIETAFLKKQEFKKFVSFRTSANATQKAVLIIAVGIFVSTCYIVSENQQKFIQEFEQEAISIALNQGGDNSGLAEISANASIQVGKQSLQQITSTPQFEKLKASQDPDAQSFVQMMTNLETQIDSPAAKELAKQKSQENMNSLKQSIDFDTIKKQIPFIQKIEEFYWLIAAFSITSAFLLVGNIIIVNLSGFFTAIILLILKKTGN